VGFHFRWLAFTAIGFSSIFQVSQRLFLLCIDGNCRFTTASAGLNALHDEFELCVPVRVLLAFDGLAVGLKAIPLELEQLTNFDAADHKALRIQCRGQCPGAFACPPQQCHRISPRIWFDQHIDSLQNLRFLTFTPLSSRAWLSLTVTEFVGLIDLYNTIAYSSI
jgi:hypothetical protein